MAGGIFAVLIFEKGIMLAMPVWFLFMLFRLLHAAHLTGTSLPASYIFRRS
jgi:hypothetical protein